MGKHKKAHHVVVCFFCGEATESTPVEGISDKSVSLGEDIVVKLYTDASTGDYNYVIVEFDGTTEKITANDEGVFSFYGVTPQKLGVELTATMYNADEEAVGETTTFSVKSYLRELFALSFENSDCRDKLQYQAMRELCVNMLNYGAAVQSYVTMM